MSRNAPSGGGAAVGREAGWDMSLSGLSLFLYNRFENRFFPTNHQMKRLWIE